MAILSYGQVGWRSASVTPTAASTLWTSVYGVWNADTLGTSLDSSIYGVYNGDNVNDTSGNARNGTNVNNVTFTTGKVGNAFTFNGSNYINLPNNSNQFNFTTDFSFSFWVYIPSVATATNGIFANYTNVGGGKGFIAYLKSDGKFEMYIVGANGTSIATSTSQIPTGWTHIVVTRKMVTAKESYIYINGVLNTQSGVNNAVTLDFYSTSNPSIGAINSLDTGPVQNLFGQMMNNSKIDGLTVWNKVLTANEITSLYNAGTGAEYPFSSQLLPSPNDSVGANNGTLTNGCTFTTGKIGKAFTFDGVNDYVALPTTSLNLVDDFSVSLWAYFNSFSNNGLVSNYYRLSPFTVYYGWSIIALGGKITFDTYNGVNATNQRVETSALATGNWYHIVVNYKEGVNTTIYINGTLSVTGNTTTPIGYSGNETPTIGGVQAGTGYQYPLNGKLDSVTVWNKVLTSTEVTELYNSGNGKQYPN